MIAVIDYGVGNLFSLSSSLKTVGADVVVTGDPDLIRQASKLVLPGVGAFADAANKLKANRLDRLIKTETENGKPLLGICLGMQLLFEKSYEYGEHEGLGLIPGAVKPIKPIVPQDYKVPHIGWNALIFPKDREKSILYRYLDEGDHMYFVHSYYAADCDPYVTARAEYGPLLTVSAENGCVYGTQFHPEKSGEKGLKILKAFCEL